MLQIDAIPAFSDNYIWLLRGAGQAASVVDPGQAAPVLAYLDRHGLRLTDILITHKHADHIGGLADLLERFPEVRIHGPANEPIKLLTRRLREGDEVQPEGLDCTFRVLDVPGHTEGHIAYLGCGRLFCGDTLFLGGCGRVFSGTHEQLAASLRRIADLPGETLVHCAHEYTLDNLGFANWVMPDSEALRQRMQRDQATRAAGRATVPAPLQQELETNPFLRTSAPEVVTAAERWAGTRLSDATSVFRALRDWKDREYD